MAQVLVVVQVVKLALALHACDWTVARYVTLVSFSEHSLTAASRHSRPTLGIQDIGVVHVAVVHSQALARVCIDRVCTELHSHAQY